MKFGKVFLRLFAIAIVMASLPKAFADGPSIANSFYLNFDYGKDPVEVRFNGYKPQHIQVENVYSPQGTFGSRNIDVTTNSSKLIFNKPSSPGELIFKVRPSTGGSIDSKWNRQQCFEAPSLSTALREDGKTFVQIYNTSSVMSFYFRRSDNYSSWQQLKPGAIYGATFTSLSGMVEVMVAPREPEANGLCAKLEWNWSVSPNQTPTTKYLFSWDNAQPGFSANSIPVPPLSVIKVDTLYGYPGGYYAQTDFGTVPFYTNAFWGTSAQTLFGFTARLKDGSYVSSVHFRSVCSKGPRIEVYNTKNSTGNSTQIWVDNGIHKPLFLRFIPNGVNSNTVPWRVIDHSSSYTFENLPKLGMVEIAVGSTTKTLCSYVTWNW